MTNALLARSEISMGDRQLPPSASTMNSRCFQQLDEGYDEEYGGFAEAPKFPTPGQCPLTRPPPPVCDPQPLAWPKFPLSSRPLSGPDPTESAPLGVGPDLLTLLTPT